MSVLCSPFGPKPQFELADGTPAVGNKLFFYVAGSVNTKQNTYTSSTGLVANANPIILNSLGTPTNEIWFTSGQTYKVVYAPSTDTDPPTSPIWTIDNLAGINDVAAAQDQWVTFTGAPTFVGVTSFTLAGDQTTAFHIGRRLKTTNSGGTVYSIITNSVFGALTTVTVVNDSGTLDVGLSAVSYGLLSADHSSIPFIKSGTTTGLTLQGPLVFSSGYAKDLVNALCDGRLTLTTAVPVTTSDVTAAETVYFTPYKGNRLALYDGTNWKLYYFTELSVDVPDATQMNDVFVYDSAGVLTLEVVAWTNTTTRATALALQDGILIKSGTTTKRYLGSFYATTAGNGQTEDSVTKRYLWNYYNRVLRSMRVVEATDTWNYTTFTYQQANASAANQLDVVIGVSEDIVTAQANARVANTNVNVRAGVGIGIDSTTVNSAQILSSATTAVVNTAVNPSAYYRGFPGIGRHTLPWLEISQATGTSTWQGDGGSATDTQSGIFGEVLA